ncbi:hypothetical protein EXIGLDRAFT_724883 [Exidia glandulosa HHB12029]|uniref:F-box domain-containing protein n=1 Tax=Exidia glandulosa HHB12029 TaxID=1314781 RepID=A0A165ZWU7_EXIGL|nr:hypothetical protein EXIGLDRAFT_724883 [Exidia glandulosa HHB12029]
MGRRAKQSTPAPPARRLTRLRLRNATAQFATFPLEIVRPIVTMTAQNNIGDYPRWVAQTLALVCREFQAAVEPVLIDTVRITSKNQQSILSQMGRFEHTRHFISHDHKCKQFPPLRSLVSFTGRGKGLNVIITAGCKPSHLTLGRASWGYRGVMVSVTHLHLQYANLPINWEIKSFPNLTHIVLSLEYDSQRHFNDIAINVSHLLSPTLKLQRILIRPYHMPPETVSIVASRLQKVADETHDTRLWIDDTPITGADWRKKAKEHLLYEEANEQETVWYSGRQMWGEL